MPKLKLDRLTEPMYYTLLALLKPRCGIEITEFVLAITKNRVRLGPGTLYAILSKFQEESLIDEIAIEGRKRTYQINKKGIEMLKMEYRQLQTMVEEGKPFMEELYEDKT